MLMDNGPCEVIGTRDIDVFWRRWQNLVCGKMRCDELIWEYTYVFVATDVFGPKQHGQYMLFELMVEWQRHVPSHMGIPV